MNKFLSLTKLQIKNWMSKYQSTLNLKRGNIGKLLYIVLAALLLYPSVQICLALYTPFSFIGHPELLVTIMYIATVMIMLLTAVPFIMSIFFYSKDTEFLSSFPITESTIVFSKLSTIYIYLLVISGFIFAPAIFIFIINSNSSMFLIIPALLTFIIAPVLPLAAATIIILPIMRFVAGSKRRNLFAIIGNIFLLVVIIVMQIFMTKLQSDPKTMQELMLHSDGILKAVGSTFPPSIWLTKMIQGSIIDAVFFIGINILLLLLLQALSKVVYRKALMSFNQHGSVSIKQGGIYFKKRSIGMQLIRRHTLIIVSNPTFFLNCILIIFLPVILFAISLFSGEISLQLLNSPILDPYKIYIFAAVISCPAIMGSNSATSISREGVTFWETKVLPVSMKDNIRYRVITTIIISLLGSVILAIATVFFISLSWLEILLGIIICISFTLFVSTIDIVINIYRPLLNWTNPTAAVKNNMNVMISLAIRVVTAGLLYLIYYTAYDLGSNIIIVLCSIVLLVLYVISRYLVYNVYVNKFKDISI